MQTKQRHNSKAKRSLLTRKNTRPSTSRKNKLRGKRIQRRGIALSNTSGNASNHLLGLPVRNFNRFSTFDNAEIDCFIDRTYKCLLNVPGFNTKKEWDKLPTKDEVALFLLREVERLTPKGFDYLISDKGEQYAIYYYQISPNGVIKYSTNCIEWLPEIYKVDPLLYEMICAAIYKISSYFNIDILTDYFMEVHIDDFGIWDSDEYDEDEKMKIINQIKQYTDENGKAKVLYQYMQRQAQNYSDKVLIDSILNLKPSKAKLKGALIKWLQLSIPCLKERVDLNSFILPLDGYDDGALNIKSNYGFYYSFFDEVSKRGEEWRNDTYSNIGEMDAAIHYMYTEDAAIQPASFEPLKALNTFMQYGRDIFRMQFENKYEKLYGTN
jgi:hypothetical protein